MNLKKLLAQVETLKGGQCPEGFFEKSTEPYTLLLDRCVDVTDRLKKAMGQLSREGLHDTDEYSMECLTGCDECARIKILHEIEEGI